MSKNVWDKVASHFGQEGPNYWGWFGQALIEHILVEDGSYVLDIGCGRGASIWPVLERIGEKGMAIGIDASEEMIKYNLLEKERLGRKNVMFQCCMLNEFKDNKQKFDYVICGFGLPFIDANKANYDVLHEVLKQDGVFALSTWTHQEDQDWMTSMVNKHLDIEGTSVKHTAYTTESGVKETLKKAGFINVEIDVVERVFSFESKEAWWQDLNFTAVRNILDALKEKGTLEAFKAEAFDGLSKYEYEGKINIHRRAILAHCRRG